MNNLFLSYRRADAPGYVARIGDELERRFGADAVFRDVDDMRAGDDWKKALARAVSGADLVIAVIGPRWQEALQAGESEWVRFELNQARTLDIPIIPLVLDGADYAPSDLPQELNWMADVQNARLGDGKGRWDADMNDLQARVAQLTGLTPIPLDEERPGAAQQVSHGDQSPNIDSGGGDVTITFGAAPKGDPS